MLGVPCQEVNEVESSFASYVPIASCSLPVLLRIADLKKSIKSLGGPYLL